jgi:hypothetical protein
VEHPHVAADFFNVWFVGYLPTAIGSASKLTSFQGIRSGFGVEIHYLAVDGFGIGVKSDDAFTVTTFSAHGPPPANYPVSTLIFQLDNFNRNAAFQS